MCFIPDMKKPVDRRACVEGIIWCMLPNCTILLLAYVHTLVCPASWEVQSLFLVFFFFKSHAAFWNLSQVVIPMCMLCCLELVGYVILGGAL